MDNTIKDSVVDIPGYRLFRQDRDMALSRKSKGGGVCFYIHNSISATSTPKPVLASMCDALTVQLRFSDSQSLLVCGCYRHPAAHVEYWSNLETYSELILQQANLKPHHLIVMGDFNLDVSGDPPGRARLTNFCDSFNLKNMHRLPTRFPSNTSIDIVLAPIQLPDGLTIGTPTVHSLHGVTDHHLVTMRILTLFGKYFFRLNPHNY